ncbi:MAG: hypothetical protein ACOCUU_02455 [Nanoarchaeota archaeon]
MIEEIKKTKYKFKEQLELYEKIKNDLSTSDKFKLIDNLINDDIFSYLELIAKFTFDIAEVSEKYVKFLERFSEKIKNDMAQWPFLNSLKEIGRRRQDIALQLYEKIMSESKEDFLKIIAGLILGGYSIEHEEKFKEMIKDETDDLRLISYMKSIIVIYEKESEIPTEVFNFLDKIEKSGKENLLRELANVSLALYDKDQDYFYDKILNIVRLNNKDFNYLIFSRLSYTETINKKRRFDLIELAKDSEEIVVDEILQILKDYPEELDKIGKLIIYWINKNIAYKLRNLDWILKELSKQNKKFIDYFFDNFGEINKKTGRHALPGLFLIISKNDISYSINSLSKLDITDKEESRLFYELCRKIISNIYGDERYYDDLIKLVKKIQESAKNRNFISQNLIREIGEKPSEQDKLKLKYDNLINLAHELLEQLEYRQNEYNFNKIDKNIRKYEEIYKYGKDIISKCKEQKRFSYLLWMGEREEPSEEKIKINEKEDPLTKSFKQQFILGKYWPRAYLIKLDETLNLYKKYPNGRFNQDNLDNEIKKNLLNENRFWTFFSELLFIEKFDKKNVVKEIEPKINSRGLEKINYLDLKSNIFGRDIYFEITRPEIDRSLKLASGRAVTLGNKSFSIIDGKYRQIFSEQTYNEMKDGKRNDLFFVVVDIGSSTVDEYGILSAFLGSPAYTLVTDKKTGRVIKEYPTLAEDSLYHKNKKTEIISGVIYFKQNLVFDGDNPKIKLVGDIIQNPNAITKLNDEEIKKLKEIIFS